MPDVIVDVSQLKALARSLKLAAPELEKNFHTALVAAGELVAIEARQQSSWSHRIPKTIRVRRRGLGVRVEAGGDAAPHAAPLEHGGIPGKFRHPVFGGLYTDEWVDQEARPFLTPAAVITTPAVVDAVLVAVDVTLAHIARF